MSLDMEKAMLQPKQSNRKRVFGHLAIGTIALLALARYTNVDWRSLPMCGLPDTGSRAAPTPGPIDWKECGKGYECGRLEVPLDYHDASAGSASLSVGRYLATSKPRLGSIFVNPGASRARDVRSRRNGESELELGGPGGSGLSFLYRAGAQLSEIVDGQYDIVSWDPRGINGTTPRVECFPDKRAQDLYNLEHDGGFEIGNLSTTADQELFREQLRVAYSEAELLAGLCEQYTGELLRHVGTSTVARDLEYFSSVVEGKDTPVNYAGFSYGTAVGAYFVNMFPDRVGRVLIDGVVEPLSWATEPAYLWGPRDLQDAEKAFEDFLVSCVSAGPERCALAANVTTARQLNAKVRGLLDDLLKHPLPVPHATRPGLLKSSDVRGTIFSAMYKPRNWPELAKNLASALAGDGAPILNADQDGLNLSDTTSPQRTQAAIHAVTCVDGPDLYGKYSSEEAVQELLDATVVTYETSPLFATLTVDIPCFAWKPREAERFIGPWNHTLANTILVLGNRADPICPLANAKAVNSYLPESRLVVQDGPGHCSLAQASLCTGKVLREYFLEGKLPENGVVCPVTEVLFPPKSNATTLSTWDFGISAESGYAQAVSMEDVKLLEKLKAFGEAAQLDMSGFKGL